MRVIDLDTVDTPQTANDDDLAKVAKAWFAENDQPLSEDEVAELVDRRACDATDS